MPGSLAHPASPRTTIARPLARTMSACARSQSTKSMPRSTKCWPHPTSRLHPDRTAPRMTIAEKAGASRNPFERIFAALIDPVRGERAVLVLLAGYAAAWSLYGAIAKGSQDLHFDIGEMFAWSHQIGLSAPTHPPLGAWLAHTWFAVMPRQDWAFYLLGILLATAALWMAWRVPGPDPAAGQRVAGTGPRRPPPVHNFTRAEDH